MVIIVVFQTTYSSSTLDTFKKNFYNNKSNTWTIFHILVKVYNKIAIMALKKWRVIELFMESQSLN
jgi:uncharacterized membrane protein YbjE (DUF340 family)